MEKPNVIKFLIQVVTIGLTTAGFIDLFRGIGSGIIGVITCEARFDLTLPDLVSCFIQRKNAPICGSVL